MNNELLDQLINYEVVNLIRLIDIRTSLKEVTCEMVEEMELKLSLNEYLVYMKKNINHEN